MRARVKILRSILLTFLLSAFGTLQVNAQEPKFDGKTVRIVVGFSAGGGFDAYARAIARHLGKHVPGMPTIIVENMPGAGSLIAANYHLQSSQTGRSYDRPLHRRRSRRPVAGQSWRSVRFAEV